MNHINIRSQKGQTQVIDSMLWHLAATQQFDLIMRLYAQFAALVAMSFTALSLEKVMLVNNARGPVGHQGQRAHRRKLGP